MLEVFILIVRSVGFMIDPESFISNWKRFVRLLF